MIVEIDLTETRAEKIRKELEGAGYSAYPRVMYIRYSKERGDSVFLHHSLNIIRCTPNTEGSAILLTHLGPPNGKRPDSMDDKRLLSWFLNGYTGKSTTKQL